MLHDRWVLQFALQLHAVHGTTAPTAAPDGGKQVPSREQYPRQGIERRFDGGGACGTSHQRNLLIRCINTLANAIQSPFLTEHAPGPD